MRFPDLVQRISTRKQPREGKSGVDHWFEFDYMGSAEFEFGALPQALRDMREHLDDVEILPFRFGVRADLYDAWYVGPNQKKFREAADQAEVLFRGELLDAPAGRLKEPTYLGWAYGRGSRRWGSTCRIDGWWALNGEPFPWALFMRKESAEKWLECLREKK